MRRGVHHMVSYEIIHTTSSQNFEKEKIKLAAARALYAELLKYYNAKTAAKKSA